VNWLEHTQPAIVDTADVDLKDETFLIPNFRDLDLLVKSVERMGIVNPPVLQESPSGTFRPVLGRRRLEVAALLGIGRVEAKLIPSSMSENDGFALAFWDNAAHRHFDRACTAYLVKRLLELFPADVVALEFLPQIGVPPKGPVLSRLQAIGKLEKPILRALSAGRIQEKTAVLMADLDSDSRNIIRHLIEDLGMNANKNADLISNLFDLAVANERAVADYVSDPGAREILDDDLRSRPQKAELFREHVRSRRNPELVSREKDIQEWIGSLTSSPMIAIRPAQAFESNEFKVEIKARSRKDVERIVNGLEAIVT
jgi:ParB family transcriptional regulator, chromosome partitioning protein